MFLRFNPLVSFNSMLLPFTAVAAAVVFVVVFSVTVVFRISTAVFEACDIL